MRLPPVLSSNSGTVMALEVPCNVPEPLYVKLSPAIELATQGLFEFSVASTKDTYAFDARSPAYVTVAPTPLDDGITFVAETTLVIVLAGAEYVRLVIFDIMRRMPESTHTLPVPPTASEKQTAKVVVVLNPVLSSVITLAAFPEPPARMDPEWELSAVAAAMLASSHG
jgi:hypothetical protein